MEQEVIIYENNFLTIFTDALMLYESAEACADENTKEALVRVCVLSICFAIEAAANSFLQAVECNEQKRDEVDRYTTLNKFCFVLQWGQGVKLKKGEPRVQRVRDLLQARHAMAHPKINKKPTTVQTEIDESGRVVHTENHNAKTKSGFQCSNLEHAENAFKIMVDFLNAFVEEWWAGDRELAQEYLLSKLNRPLKAGESLIEKHQLRLLIKHNEMLQIKFIGIYGLLPGEEFR